MDEGSEIKSLGEGRYSFWIGRQRYTLSTKLEAARFCRVVDTVRELVDGFPSNLSQDERLVLALMAFSHKLDELGERVDELAGRFGGDKD
ncbi:MAG: hypothetical protein Q4D58_04590 [Synergistaceae bacterium]|nr:hypothetical protein [Synergistaceae bacterium]